MDDTWDIAEDGEQDVDEQVTTAAALQEDAHRWQEDGHNDFADVTGT